jgi:hypothetical protein
LRWVYNLLHYKKVIQYSSGWECVNKEIWEAEGMERARFHLCAEEDSKSNILLKGTESVKWRKELLKNKFSRRQG